MTAQTAGMIPEFTMNDRLRKAREVAGLDQEGLADRMEVSRATVSNAERGTVKVRRAVLASWSLATGVDRQWIETGYTARDSNPEPAD